MLRGENTDGGLHDQNRSTINGTSDGCIIWRCMISGGRRRGQKISLGGYTNWTFPADWFGTCWTLEISLNFVRMHKSCTARITRSTVKTMTMRGIMMMLIHIITDHDCCPSLPGSATRHASEIRTLKQDLQRPRISLSCITSITGNMSTHVCTIHKLAVNTWQLLPLPLFNYS